MMGNTNLTLYNYDQLVSSTGSSANTAAIRLACQWLGYLCQQLAILVSLCAIREVYFIF